MQKNETKNPVIYRAILVFNLIFILACAAVSVVILASPAVTTPLRVGALLTLAALVLATLYTVMGFSKKQAWAHKLFLVFFILTMAYTLYHLVTSAPVNAFECIMAAVAAILGLALLVGKDLGARNSMTLSIIISAACLLITFRAILGDSAIGPDGDPYRNLLLIRSTANWALSILLINLTFSKYVDKILRGRKLT